jgi:iron complex transport system substrate-binding protein
MNEKKLIGLVVLIVLVVSIFAAYILVNHSSSGVGNVQITDMVGRSVAVPSTINKVIATSPPTTNLVYMIAPDKLGAWNSNLTDIERRYIPKKYQELPVVGGWFSTNQGNPENFLAVNPSIILYDCNNNGNSSPTMDSMQQMMGSVPVVGIQSSTNVTNFTSSIEFSGKLLGEESNANKLVTFYTSMLKTVNSTVSSIPSDQRVRVYYAEGPAGLQTDASGSQHSQLIELCGGVNVADIPVKQGKGMSEVNMEQILMWNPAIIITNDPNFFTTVYSNSSWQYIDAVKNHKVYMAPTAPVGWFDRPPGINTIIGIPWTAKVLYPNKFETLNMTSLTKEFYSNFYHVDLTDDDIKNIMYNQTI